MIFIKRVAHKIITTRLLLKIIFAFFTIVAQAQDTIKLNPYVSYLKTIDVYIQNKKYKFLFDTGGGETFISPAIAKDMNKTVYGLSFGFRMSGEKFAYQKCDSITLVIDKSVVTASSVAVWDVMGILPAGFPHIDGVLSLKTFVNNVITLDFSIALIIVETEKSVKRIIRKATQIPARFATGSAGNEMTLIIGVKKNEQFYWFLFDSGNLDNFRFSPVTAYEWGLKGDTVSKREELKPTLIGLGKKHFNINPVSENIIYDGAMNYDFIKEAVFIIDFRQQKVWMK